MVEFVRLHEAHNAFINNILEFFILRVFILIKAMNPTTSAGMFPLLSNHEFKLISYLFTGGLPSFGSVASTTPSFNFGTSTTTSKRTKNFKKILL